MSAGGHELTRPPPVYGLVQTVAPAKTPLDLPTVKHHVRVQGHDQDELLQQYLEAATALAEDRTRRQLISATWQLTLDCFWRREIRLPKGATQSITSIVYVDTAGVSQTLSGSAYRLETGYEPAIVEPVYGTAWPATRAQSGAVKITFVAGDGDDPSDVKASVRQAMLLCINDWWESPGNAIIGASVNALPVPTRAVSLFRGAEVADWFEEYGPES